MRAQLAELDSDIDVFFPPLPTDASLPLISMIAGQLADFVAPGAADDDSHEGAGRIHVEFGDGLVSPPSLEQVGEIIRKAVSGAVSGLSGVAQAAGKAASKAAESMGWIDTDEFSDEELAAEVATSEARLTEIADKGEGMTLEEAEELREVTRRFARLKMAQVKRDVASQVSKAKAAATSRDACAPCCGEEPASDCDDAPGDCEE